MSTYIVRNLNLLFFTLLVLCVISFSLGHLLPGSALANFSGIQNLSVQQASELSEQYGLEQNVLVQFWYYWLRLLDGDWGLSFSSGLPVYDEIMIALPASIELSTYALLVSLLVGLPLGLLAGFKHYRPIDLGLLSLSVVSYSVPVFWLALIFIMVFSLQLGWFPMSGRLSLLFDVPYQTGFILLDILLSELPNKYDAFLDALSHMILPTLSIAFVTFTIILRTVRRSVIDVLQKDYIQAAYTRGLSHRQVFMRHVLRNALLPILPMLATQFTVLLTSVMIVEIIFSWPGIGSWLIQAIYQRDYPAIRAGMLIVSALVVLFTISINILFKFVDPTSSRTSRV